MTFFIVLIVVLAELNRLSLAPLRGSAWPLACYRLLAVKLNLRGRLGSLTPLVCVAVTSAVVVYLQLYVIRSEGLLGFVAGVTVLLFCCGPRDLLADIDDYTFDHLDTNGPQTLGKGNLLAGIASEQSDMDGAVMRKIAVSAFDAVFAPVIWYVILGPVGAVLYRLTSTLARDHSEISGAERKAIGAFSNVLAWMPGLLFAFALGLAGALAPVIEVLRRSANNLPALPEWLGAAALAALARHRDSQHANKHVDAVFTMWRLVRRGIIVFLVVLGLLVAAGIVD